MANGTLSRSSEAKMQAAVLEKSITNPRQNLTIADGAAASGLALRNAEIGLHFLIAEYRGHLSATENGELLFCFPYGFAKPWEKIEALQAFWQKVKKGLLGVAKFVVRAWITVVMVAYVAAFAAILIALMFAKSSDRDDRDRGSSFGGNFMFYALMRAVMDSLFWTFHPFSPYNVSYDPYYRRNMQPKIPFYERVNRFFFGPEKPPVDPLEMQRRVLAEIRVQRGRVGLADVMKVTGLPRDRADPLMSRLMLDYDGEVSVSESGGVTYAFPELRKTVQNDREYAPEPIWARKETVMPLTGNPAGSNVLIAALNGFNWVMSLVAISGGWTIANLKLLLFYGVVVRTGDPAILLGWVPFIFSSALFALPIFRALNKDREKTRVARENGRRGLLFAVLNRLTRRGVREETLKTAWTQAAGVQPKEKELVAEVVKLGGELEVDENGGTQYRFKDLELELSALQTERSQARESEKDVGQVVFSSAK